MIKNYRLIARSIRYAFILSHSTMVFSMQQTPEVDEKPYFFKVKQERSS
jgi:hypothetical protein